MNPYKHDYDAASNCQVVIHHILTSSKNCDTPCGHLVLNQVYLNPYYLIWLFFDSKIFIVIFGLLKSLELFKYMFYPQCKVVKFWNISTFFNEKFIKMTLHPKNIYIFSFHKQKKTYTKKISKKLKIKIKINGNQH